MLKNKKNVILILAVVFCLSIFSAVYATSAENNKNYSSAASLVDDYLYFLNNGFETSDNDVVFKTDDKFANIIKKMQTGYEPNTKKDSSVVPISEVEGKGNNVLKDIPIEKIDKSKVLSMQKEFVKQKFGDDAWQKVKYIIKKLDCPYKIEKCFNKETKKVISEKDCIELGKAFWGKVCNEEGISFNDFYNYLDGTTFDGELNQAYEAIYLKYMEKNPSVRIIADEYDTVGVYFSFNDKTSSQEANDFKITLINKNGSWEIFEGLTWTEEILDPESDI